MQLSVQRPSSPQLSAQTAVAESTEQVESVIMGRINKREVLPYSCVSFPVLRIIGYELQAYYLFTA